MLHIVSRTGDEEKIKSTICLVYYLRGDPGTTLLFFHLKFKGKTSVMSYTIKNVIKIKYLIFISNSPKSKMKYTKTCLILKEFS
jgi:hypothetical protein